MPDLSHRGTIVSVGYEGRTADELVAVLHSAEVDLLVDVRLTPASRKPGLSKNKLADRLAAEGIAYRHVRELGNPRDNREAFRSGRPAARRRYVKVLDNGAGSVLDDLLEEARNIRIAMLCFERDHDECHRSCITDRALEKFPLISVLRR